MKPIDCYYRSLAFYACVPRVSMKLLNWHFQCGVSILFHFVHQHWCYELICIKGFCINAKKVWMKVQLFLVRV